MTLKKIKHTLILAAVATASLSCSGSSTTAPSATETTTTTTTTTTTATTASTAPNATCAPVHDGAVWTKSECGPVDAMWLDQNSTGDDSSVLSTRSVNKGRLTFKVSGISSDYAEKERWFMWFLSDIGGAGANFQLMVVTSSDTRLIMQRFDDFSDCSPRGLAGGRWGCEEQDIHDDLFFEPSKTYAWDCSWDGTAASKLVTCTATATDGSFSTTYQVGMGGAYAPLTEMGVGTFSIDGYPVVQSTVTDFRLSFF